MRHSGYGALGPSFLCSFSRAVIPPLPLPPERRIPHMDDGGGVGIEAPPARLPVEGGDDPVNQPRAPSGRER
jgi:hypothetical protein